MKQEYKDILKKDFGDSIHLNRYIKLIEYYEYKKVNVEIEKHHILPRSIYPDYIKEKLFGSLFIMEND